MISSMDKNLAGISSRHNLVHGQYSWQIFLYCILFPKVMQCPHEFISWISRFCGGTVGGACCKVALVVTWCRHKHARVYLHQLESFCGRILLLFGLFRKLEGFVAVTGQQEKKKKKRRSKRCCNRPWHRTRSRSTAPSVYIYFVFIGSTTRRRCHCYRLDRTLFMS